MKEYLSNLLHAGEFDEISRFLEIPAEKAMDACRNFRATAQNVYDQLKIEPFRFSELTTEIEKHKTFFIGQLVLLAAEKYKTQKHGNETNTPSG